MAVKQKLSGPINTHRLNLVIVTRILKILLTGIWVLSKPLFSLQSRLPESRQPEFQVPVLNGNFPKRKNFSPLRFRYSHFPCLICFSCRRRRQCIINLLRMKSQFLLSETTQMFFWRQTFWLRCLSGLWLIRGFTPHRGPYETKINTPSWICLSSMLIVSHHVGNSWL